VVSAVPVFAHRHGALFINGLSRVVFLLGNFSLYVRNLFTSLSVQKMSN
jgi:hypothetical protein